MEANSIQPTQQAPVMPAATGRQDLFTLAPRNLQEAMQYADLIANSGMVPKDYKGQPGNVLVAVQMGAEIGLPPTQALQNIAVINGRPSLWGDALKAVVMASPICLYIKEWFDEQSQTAYCETQRKGSEPHTETFSFEDAKRAGLSGKQGPWSQYPRRMMQMRARGFCLRDQYPDVLKGIALAEEEQDRPAEKDVTPEPSAPANTSKTGKLTQRISQRTSKPEVVEAEQPTVDHTETVKQLVAGIVNCQTQKDLDVCGEDIARIGVDIPDDLMAHVRAAFKKQKAQLAAQANT